MKDRYIIIITFIWIGFVCAISFMEAWLKFQAPNITLELGLGIGQLVFSALNKVEIVCAILILALSILDKTNRGLLIKNLFFIPAIILVIQTLYLLPKLDERAVSIINQIEVPKSKMHLWFVFLELIKVATLFIYGVKRIARIQFHTEKNGVNK